MTEIDFRSVGYTEEAKQFPMNDIDLVARAAWNGVAVSQLPEAMRYYPNRHMQDTWRRVIDAVRDADGRATGRVNKIDPTTMAKMTGHLRAAGIGRDPENDRVVFLSLNRVPTDDELRAIHGAISRTPATCPFCTKPTYVLPCSHCGEPDVPEDRF